MTSPNVNQEMIDAYYEYTHLTLDRRKFANKLRELAEAEAKPRSVLIDLDRLGLRTDADVKRTQ